MIPEKLIRRWVTATILGWLMGFMLVLFLAFLVDAIGLGGYQFFIGIGMGLGVGYMQGRVLMFYYGIGYRWIIASTVGMGVSFILFDFGHAFTTLFPEYNLLYSTALGGLITGVLQYFILKPVFKKAILWIPFCLAGWFLAGLLIRLSEVIESLGLTGLPAAIIVLIILTIGSSLALGLITGLGLKKVVEA